MYNNRFLAHNTGPPVLFIFTLDSEKWIASYRRVLFTSYGNFHSPISGRTELL